MDKFWSFLKKNKTLKVTDNISIETKTKGGKIYINFTSKSLNAIKNRIWDHVFNTLSDKSTFDKLFSRYSKTEIIVQQDDLLDDMKYRTNYKGKESYYNMNYKIEDQGKKSKPRFLLKLTNKKENVEEDPDIDSELSHKIYRQIEVLLNHSFINLFNSVIN